MEEMKRYSAWRGLYMTVVWMAILFAMSQWGRLIQQGVAVQPTIVTPAESPISTPKPSAASKPTAQSVPPARPQASQPVPEVLPPQPEPPAYHLTPILPYGNQPTSYSLTIQQCRRGTATIECWGVATNRTDVAGGLSFYNGSAVDDEGNEVSAYFSNDPKLIPGTPTRFNFEVRDPHLKATEVTIQFITSFGTINRAGAADSFIFKDIPIQ
jgi:hypothetical protein